ncbi:hypothetical protein WNY59_04025 [Ahrensia kielensis]|uniref:Uncharacterized protein n=1 Tax=Ahrensia kielensis TaxID=76980 RepID=A0ABU9T3Q7_9HYPH
MNIAVAIERNRIALLRIVFCWLSAAYVINVRADKPLPRRLSAWVLDLIINAEKAAGFLLVTIFYSDQIIKRFAPDYEKAACDFMAFNSAFTLGTLTIGCIIKRLKSLRHILLNLHAIVRRLAYIIAARARVASMKLAAQNNAFSDGLSMTRPALTHEDAIPP